MLTTRSVLRIFSVGVMVLGAGVVFSQNYPNKTIRIVTSGVGSGLDFATRLIASGISGPLGQPVVVDNRPSGVIPGQTVSQAPPDGYTLLVAAGSLWVLPFLQDNVPWDALRDFSPITLVDSSPNILVVHPSLPVKSVKELIALAKARPGALNYASGGTGGAAHLAAELFKSMAGGINIARIPYKGSVPSVNAILGGEVQMTFSGVTPVAPHIKAGRLRGLAVSSAQPSALFPSLPAVAATVPGYEMVGIEGLYAPAKTPDAIIKRLHQEVVRVLNSADAKEKFFNVGSEVIGSAPEQLAAFIKADMARMGKLIKDAGIRTE